MRKFLKSFISNLNGWPMGQCLPNDYLPNRTTPQKLLFLFFSSFTASPHHPPPPHTHTHTHRHKHRQRHRHTHTHTHTRAHTRRHTLEFKVTKFQLPPNRKVWHTLFVYAFFPIYSFVVSFIICFYLFLSFI